MALAAMVAAPLLGAARIAAFAAPDIAETILALTALDDAAVVVACAWDEVAPAFLSYAAGRVANPAG